MSTNNKPPRVYSGVLVHKDSDTSDTITDRDWLKSGYAVWIPFHGRNRALATVKSVVGDTAYAECSGYGYHLSHGKDDRKCWACTTAVKLGALAKLKV